MTRWEPTWIPQSSQILGAHLEVRRGNFAWAASSSHQWLQTPRRDG